MIYECCFSVDWGTEVAIYLRNYFGKLMHNIFDVFFKKFLSSSFIQLIGAAVSVLLGIMLARYLGPDKYGVYSLTIAVISFLSIPVIAGTPLIIVREIAKCNNGSGHKIINGIIIWSVLWVVFISFIIFLIIYIINVFDINVLKIDQYLIYAVFLIPLRGLLYNISAIFNGFSFSNLSQFPNVLFVPLFTLVFVYVLFSMNYNVDIISIIEIQIYVSFMCILIFMVILFRKIKFRKVKPKFLHKKWGISLLPFTLMVLISTLNTEISSIMLGLYSNLSSVAYFKVAAQGTIILTLILKSLDVIIGPEISYNFSKNNKKEIQMLLNKSVKINIIMSLPIALLFIFKGDWFISILFGKEYVSSAIVLSILSLGQIVNILTGSAGQVLNMTNKENETLKSLIYAIIVNVMLMVILIPIYHEIGAAISVAVSTSVLNILMAKKVYQEYKLKTWLSLNMKVRC